MNEQDEDLRERLARLDPVSSSCPVDPSTSPRAHELLERIMLTSKHATETTTTTATWRRSTSWAVAAAAVLALGAGGFVATRGASTPATPETTLSLTAPGGGDGTSMASCMMFSVDILQQMPLAFGGTVTDIDGDRATLRVDHWYKGGSASLVSVSVPSGNISVDAVAFTPGTRYLVTATDGTVNACGYTGEATPDLEQAFAQAFTP